MRLNSQTLSQLGNELPTPQYERDGLRAGIVHFGVGGFHRAHHAMYIDRLLNQGVARDWAICGIGVLPGDARMRDVLTAQDGLYTLVLKHADGRLEPRVVGSIIDYLYAPDNPDAVIERLAHPDTRIVSLTITEGGYNVEGATGRFDLRQPSVAADLSGTDLPSTVFGLVVEGLRRRRTRGIPAFTIASCDNIQGNGHIARHAFATYAEALDPDLGAWVRREVHFPSSMVDRITPVTTPEDIVMVSETFGIDDGWPVVCEPFVQWVVEEDFPLGRPDYEAVGAQVVHDVEPYELMKLRLLNASHQAMCYFGVLLGYRYAHEAAADPVLRRLLERYMEQEGSPTLLPVAGIDLREYRATLLERFSNPEIEDTLARLCMDSSDRIPKWLLPVVRHNLANDGPIALSAAVVASWARYAEGVDENGREYEIVDPLKADVSAAAHRYRQQPDAFLENRSIFGDLIDEPRFHTAYLRTLSILHEDGAAAALEDALNASRS